MKCIIQLILILIIMNASHSILLSQCNDCFTPETQFQLDTSPDGVLFMDACIISACAKDGAESLTLSNPCGFDSIPTFWIDVYTMEDAKMLYVEVTENDKPLDVSIAIYKGDCNSLSILSFSTSSKTISCSQDDGSSHRIHMPLTEESNEPYHVAIGLIDGINEDNEIQVCVGVTNELYYCNSDAQPSGQNYSCNPKTTFQVIERSFSNEIDSDGDGVPGPFCPNEEIRIEFAYPFNLEGAGNGWFQGIIPMNNDNFLPIIPEKAHFSLSGGQWFGEGIPISNEVISRLCTYTDRYGRLQICNDLCNSCPCQGPIELGQPLPGGWFWLSFGGGGCANDGTPSTMYGFPTSNPIVVEGYMDITVRDFVNIMDCSSDKTLQFGFQPFTDGMTGCWEDPNDECDILPGQTIEYEIDCNLPNPPSANTYEQMINSGGIVDIVVSPTSPDLFVELIPIDNPEIEGAQSHLEEGTFNLLDQLTNLSSDEQVQQYIIRTRDTSIVCPSLQDTINITIAGKICEGVKAVQYQIRYNDTTDLYDCYLVIKSGCATNPLDLVQFNSQFSIIMATGSEYEIELLYNPIRTDNEEPMNWLANELIQNPAALPGYDFHTITPEISPIAQYPSLDEGDTLRLFSLSVISADLCDIPIRLYENGIDPDSSEPSMNGADMSQGFTIGGFTQIYDSNVEGVVPNNNIPSVSILGDTTIAIGETTMVSPQTGGVWQSSDNSIVTVNNTGLATGVGEGCAELIFTDTVNQCSSEPIEICVISGQIDKIQYQVRYNQENNWYDCYMVVKEGFAISPAALTQFNSQYSIVVDTGSQVNIVENHNPKTIMGDHVEWVISTQVKSPEANPLVDFYSITPSLSPTGYYQELMEGDTVILFSLFVDHGMNCSTSIRLYKNGVDPGPNDNGMAGLNFEQKMSIGGFENRYHNNLPSITPSGILPIAGIEGDTIISVFQTTQLTPNASGTWVSSDPSVATVTNAGLVTGISPGCANFTYSEAISGCLSNPVEICVVELMEPYLEDSLLCEGQNTYIINYDAYQFEIVDSSIISIDSGGIINSISAGTTQILATGPNGYTKTLTIIIYESPEASNLGRDTIPINGKTQLIPMIGGTWTSSNPQVAIISPSGLVTGVSVGCTEFIFTSNITGCQSNIVEVCVGLSSNTNEFTDNTDVTLYPNPTNNFVRIISNQIPKNISIFNLEGKLLTQTQFKDHFDLSQYQKGIYIVKIDFIKGSTFRKIVKN